METANTFADYSKWLAQIVCERQASIVSIDGCDGVGKSPLARRLTSLLDATHINVDDYLDKGQSTYVDSLNWRNLRANIDAAIQRQMPVIVEGLCLLEVLARAGFDPGYKVYMQVHSPEFHWFSEGDEDEPRRHDDRWYKQNVLDCEHGEYRDYGEQLDPELGRYHRDYKPRMNADLIVIYYEHLSY